MSNLGYATLQVIPSLRDVSRNVTRQLNARMRSAGREAGAEYGRGVASGVERGIRGVDAHGIGRQQGHRYGQGFVAGARSGLRNIVAGFAIANAAASAMISHVGRAATMLGIAARITRHFSASLLAGATILRTMTGAGLARIAGLLRIVATVAGHVAREISRITSALIMLRAVATVIGTLTRIGRVLGMITIGSAVALGALSALAPVIAALGSALMTLGAAAGGAAVAGLSALGAATATVKIGLLGVGDAFKSMGKAATGGGGATVDTAKQVQRAQNQLSRAVKDERDAQRDVGRARDDARKKLRDLSFELRGAALSEKDAELSLREARNDLAAGKFETSTDRERAVLRVQEAELRLAETRKDNNDLEKSAADTRARGVEGSEEVVSAQERLADATQSVKDAQDALNEARAPQAGGGGTDPFAEAMAKLSTNAQQTMLAVRGVTPAWESLRKSVQDEMFAGIASQVQPLAATWFPRLGDSMRTVAAGFNQGARSAMSWVNSAQGINVVSTWMGTSSSMAATLGTALGNLVPGLAAIGAGAGQAFGPMSQGLGAAAKSLSDWLVRMQQSGQMAEFFRTAVATLTQTFRNVAAVLGPVLSAFRQLGAVSAAGLAPGFASIGQAIAQATPGLVQMAERLMPALGQALSNIAPIIPALVQAFTPWSEILAVIAPHIATVMSHLGPMAPILLGIALAAKMITTAMVAYNAVMAIASVAQGVYAFAVGRTAASLGANTIALAAYNATKVITNVLTWAGATAMRAFGAALRFAMGPVGLIIIGISALVAGLVWFFTKTEIGQKIWTKVWSSIKSAVQATWEFLKPVFAWIGEAFGKVVGFIRDNWRMILPFILGPLGLLISVVSKYWNQIKAAFTVAFQAIGAVAVWLWQNVIQPAWTGIQAAVSFAWGVIKGIFSVFMSVLRVVGTVVMWLWNNVVTPAFNGIKAVIGFVWGGIKFYFDAFMAAIRLIGGVANWLWQNVMMPVWNGIKATIEGFWNGVQAVFGWITDKFRWIGNVAGEVKDRVVEHFGLIVGFVKSLPAKIANAASGMWDGIKNTFKQVLNWIIQKWNDFSISMKVPDSVPIIGGKGFTIDTPNLPMLAGGGAIRDRSGALSGPGTPTSDSIYGVNRNGVPVVRVADSERVMTARSRDRGDNERIQEAMNAGAAFSLPGYAGGGVLPKSLDGYTTPDGINGGTVNLGDISGPGVTTGIQLSMWDTVRKQFPDVKLFSATRTVQTEGHADFHNAGKAIDLSPSQAIADWISRTFGSRVLELFWDPGPNMDDGKPTGAIGGHSDHVHWAMDEILRTEPPAPEVGPPAQVPETEVPPVSSLGTTSNPTSPGETGTTTTETPGSGQKSISDRFGEVAKSAVQEQITDALGVVAVSDSPGWLQAIGQYEEDNKPQTTTTGDQSTTGTPPATTTPPADQSTTPAPAPAPAPQAPGKKQIPGVGSLTMDSPVPDVARAIVGEAQRRKFSWTDAVAQVSTGLAESGLRMVNNPAGWHGYFQQDASYPGRDNPNENISEFFNRLEAKKHPDIWKRIFWLQQRPGEPNADAAFANGRQAYMTEIQSPRGRADALVRGIVTPELFDRGGRLTDGIHLVENARGHDETILPQTPEEVFGRLDAAIRSIEDYANGGGPRTVINNVTNATFRDEDEYYRQARRNARMGMRQKTGGRAAVMA
ncbi:tail length tape measure protein [Gordonia phage Hedwig]|uniref:Tape measure protein n=1 Tax=Gordonia phage Hedwig TaxID=1887648 RepID=A0A1C9EHP8_9CAUD|nr:tail length tape measure protein [Gordonia phage Hedwig]AON97311.1 tape measure protein [Gordonia phage Hedwig]